MATKTKDGSPYRMTAKEIGAIIKRERRYIARQREKIVEIEAVISATEKAIKMWESELKERKGE